MKTLKYIQPRLVAFLTFLVLLVGTSTVSAQTEAVAQTKATEELEEIVGTVYDAATKELIPGVRVEALNNNRYTAMTKPDGTFTIKVPAHVASLYISTPGYESVIIKARQKGDIKVYLYDDKFGSFVENGFDVTSKSEAVINMSKATTLETEVQNQLGAEVRTIMRSGTVGLGGLMLMQGINSINASAQPLIVLNGVIQDLQDGYSAIHEGYYNNTLAAIDVNDIEKITVLKNATSIYGAKGANGVILIDTRRGHSMATRIEAQAYGSYTMTPRLPQMMNAEQYRIYANELMGGITTTKDRFPFLWDHDNYYYNMYHNETNWSDYIYRNAWAQNYRVNVQGGDEAAMYNFSLGFADGASTIKSNDFNRLNVRFNTDINLSKSLKTRFDISYSRIVRDLRDDGIQQNLETSPMVSPGFLSLIKAPFLSPYRYNNAGELTGALENADDFAKISNSVLDNKTVNNSYANPLAILEYGDGNNKNNQEYTVFDVTIAPEWTIGKGWSASTLFNYTLHRTSEKYFRPMTGTPNFLISGTGYSQNEVRSFFSKEEAIYNDTRVTWEKKYGYHNFNAFGGFRFSNFAYDSNFMSAHNTGNDKLPDVKATYSYTTTDGEENVWRNMSYYANLDYNYQNKYFLQGSVAAETSSRFGRETEGGIQFAGVSWGIFPSLQAGWLVSAEDFFNTNVVNVLKLRAGIDYSGNDNINNNAAFTYFENVQYSGPLMGIKMANIENQAIQWETTRRLNFGLDMQAFNNRLRIAADVFHNTTSNLLTLKQLSYLTGLEYYWCNGGAMNNTGATVNVTGRAINTKDWKWEVGVNVGTYKNQVTKLPDGTTFNSQKDGALYGYTTDIYDATILTAVGQAAGVFFGYETDGVYATSADVPVSEKTGLPLSTQDVNTGILTPFEAGDVKFVDQDGNGIINLNDRVIIGNPNPDLYGNISSNLMYKNFSLSATLNYSLGNDVYNYQRSLLESGSSFYNQTTAVTNRWKTEGDVTDMPRATYGDPKGNNRFSDRWIEDGSYIRLKDITLAYNVPVKASWLQGLTVWCAGTNLLTFSKYLGSDPEFSFSNNVLYQGIDNGMLGQSRSFQLGVKINL
ncbi:MAG: SusC/RagA family TonB-linked outer membrane protein [Bacteroidaceae bacterium]|nr:SusC/RagA family TonB-linked outer membrane protein [Bacteroidaceae bacterium]